jgi:hypothetical protein
MLGERGDGIAEDGGSGRDGEDACIGEDEMYEECMYEDDEDMGGGTGGRVILAITNADFYVDCLFFSTT